MSRQQPNELDPRLLGGNSMNTMKAYVSASREQMSATQMGQRLCIAGAQPPIIQSGTERDYGKYTFRVEMPDDGKILKILPRYANTYGEGSIVGNTETIVIYENIHTKEVGMIELADYRCNHQYFGFKYKPMPGLNKLRTGEIIEKGTVFLDSPAITDEGDYAYGIQANIAYMSHPGVAEDGIVISRDFLPSLNIRTYETRIVEWGQDKFALNIYGTPDKYKSFPDLGGAVRDDGLVMALRSYDEPDLAVVERSMYDCMFVNHTFDECIFAPPGGRIVSLMVHHHLADTNIAEKHMDEQAQMYDRANRVFCKEVVALWKDLTKRTKNNLKLTPKFSNLITYCISVTSDEGEEHVSKAYQKTPLNTYRLEIVIEYNITPDIGFKGTDTSGGKGVFCQILEPHEMPVDAEGNRADVMMSSESTINRTNPGRIYRQYINSASRDAWKRMCRMLGVEGGEPRDIAYAKISGNMELVLEAYWYARNYYKLVSLEMDALFNDGLIDHDNESILKFVSELIEKGKDDAGHLRGFGLYIPTNHQKSMEDVVHELEQIPEYRPIYTPVSYVGNSGKRVTTKDNVRIGPEYIILLEKIADDWTAVNSCRTNHFGVPAQLTKSDKYSNPASLQAGRIIGEAENRAISSNAGPLWIAEIMDRNNNPHTHRAICEGLLSAKNPSNIDNLIDRKEIQFGGDKPHMLLKHTLEVGGLRFKHVPYDPTQKNKGATALIEFDE